MLLMKKYKNHCINRLIPFFSFVLFMTFLFISCENDKNSFTEKEYKVIDSLYNLRINSYADTLDTMCDSVYQKVYPQYVDSIKVIRKREILDLIGS